MKTKNFHMTKKCGHGDQDMCDYCLIAYGDHAERPGAKSHSIRETGERYTCASCAPVGGQDARLKADVRRASRMRYNDRAGYVAMRRRVGGPVVIYVADLQGIDVGGAYHAIVCEAHGTICGTNDLKDARVLMRSVEFCEDCMAAAEGSPAPMGDSGAVLPVKSRDR